MVTVRVVRCLVPLAKSGAPRCRDGEPTTRLGKTTPCQRHSRKTRGPQGPLCAPCAAKGPSECAARQEAGGGGSTGGVEVPATGQTAHDDQAVALRERA